MVRGTSSEDLEVSVASVTGKMGDGGKRSVYGVGMRWHTAQNWRRRRADRLSGSRGSLVFPCAPGVRRLSSSSDFLQPDAGGIGSSCWRVHT